MTGLTGLTVWGETVKKVKTVRTKNYMTKLCGERGGKFLHKQGFGREIVAGGYFYTRSGCEMVISAPGEEA